MDNHNDGATKVCYNNVGIICDEKLFTINLMIINDLKIAGHPPGFNLETETFTSIEFIKYLVGHEPFAVWPRLTSNCFWKRKRRLIEIEFGFHTVYNTIFPDMLLLISLVDFHQVL